MKFDIESSPMLSRRSFRHSSGRTRRSLRLESLESRTMLTAAPTVVEVHFNTEEASGDELYDRLTSVAITFDKDVEASIDEGDLTLWNITTQEAVDEASDVTWDDLTKTATWDFSLATIDFGRHEVRLSATGVSCDCGHLLDGDGNGTPGDDFVAERVVTITGDADLDGDVDEDDVDILIENFTGPSGSGKTWSDGDFDADGDVDNTDAAQVLANWTDPEGGWANPTVVEVHYNTEEASGDELYDRITSISITFDKDVGDSIDEADLTLFNITTNEAVDEATDVTWDDETWTATWDFSEATIEYGRHEVRLSSLGVYTAFGSKLDGDGNGTPGDDFVAERIVTILGDADLDGDVDEDDVDILIENFTGPSGSGKTWSDGDFDADGDVDNTDAAQVLANWTDPEGGWENPKVIEVHYNTEETNGDELYDRITSVSITFDKDVEDSLGAGDLTLLNITTNQAVDAAASVSWDSETLTATWDFSEETLDYGRHEVRLSGTGVYNLFGNLLDGNGDGTPTDDFVTVRIVTILGDADLDGDVDEDDVDILIENFTGPSGSGKTWSDGDFDADGDVDNTDAAQVLANWTDPEGGWENPQVVAVHYNTEETNGDELYDRITSVSITFDKDVEDSLGVGDLVLWNLTTDEAVDTASSVSWDSETLTATWDFSEETLDYGFHEVRLSGTGVYNLFGNLLDGNGDGYPTDDFVTTRVVTYLGDADLDGDVDDDDVDIVLANFTGPSGSGMTWAHGDFDADGDVDNTDAAQVLANYTGCNNGWA